MGWDIRAIITAFGEQPHPRVPSGLSVGALSLLLGVLAALGVVGSRGLLTRISAVLALAVVLVSFGALAFVDPAPASGLLAVSVSAVVAYIGGALARAPAR